MRQNKNFMSIDDYKYLWDGSQPGWELQRIDKIIWRVVFKFGESGPSKKEIVDLHKLLPEFKSKSVTEVYKILYDQSFYQLQDMLGNIEARSIYEEASKLGIMVEIESIDDSDYLVVFKDDHALIIDDNELYKLVVQKMIDKNVKVNIVHID